MVWQFVRRDLRGGWGGMVVFLLCLALGVASISTVGTVRLSVERALQRQGAMLVGGQAEMSFTYRYASADERAYMAKTAEAVSEVVSFRSMIVFGAADTEERALTDVKAVDDFYPLQGKVILDPPLDLADALAGKGGVAGAVLDPVLVDRLGMSIGDHFRLGSTEFRLTAILKQEPDASMSMALGPRSIVRSQALNGSGLLTPGSMFETHYRMGLPAAVDLGLAQDRAEALFRDKGMRWRDARSAAPGAEKFVDRLGSFLTLVGLAGLAVGGGGIASAVRAYLARKIETMAVLKVLGAKGRTVLAIYLFEVALISIFGILAGLVLGAILSFSAQPLLAAFLPVPVEIFLGPLPLLEAAIFGALTVAIFACGPLAEVRGFGPAALFRGEQAKLGLPRWKTGMTIFTLCLVLVAAALAFTSPWWLTTWTLAAIAGAMGLLALAGAGTRRLASRLRRHLAYGAGFRLALASIGARRGDATATILSLGLGLSVLAAVGQIDTNLRDAISQELPKVAPAFFFVDIQHDQIEEFRRNLGLIAGVDKIDAAPMLRGMLTKINDLDARKVAGDHWVVRGDRGVTYSDSPPENTKITAGAWWPKDYAGPAQVSFAAQEALEIGLRLGDKLTINILGRDIDATVTSLREVDFSSAGIGFVMSISPSAIAGAPHSFIATVYAAPEVEAEILRKIGAQFPNVTAIRVREVTQRVALALGSVARATAIAAGVTLFTGIVVLIGSASAGLPARMHEAAVLKTLGASRAQVLRSFALRSALTGAVAGLVAMVFGTISGWAVMRFVMESSYHFALLPALVIVIGGAVVSLIAGLAFAWGPVSARPAVVLRARD